MQATSENPGVDMMVMKKFIIEELKKGKESTQMIRNLLLQLPRLIFENDQDYCKTFDHHSMVALTTIDSSLKMLKCCTSEGNDVNKKRKIESMDQTDNASSNHDHATSEESGGETLIQDRRGRYKRSKTSKSRVEEVTHLTDDGFAWRKYGQKAILNTKHPRHYYRCTHKYDQKCQALKQVQQISDKPTTYKIIYHGNHTCNNMLTVSNLDIDSLGDNSSGFVLRFGSSDCSTKHTPKTSMFPASAFPRVVAQDSSPMSEETSPVSSHWCEDQNQCSPSSDNSSSISENLTATNDPSSIHVSDQSDAISAIEKYSFTNEVALDDYSFIMADYSDQVFQDIWASLLED